ncbi:hypothetical protein D3C74_313810 [compost metagenome]
MNAYKVRVREVSIIMSLFLTAHGEGFTLCFIPTAGLLYDYAAIIQDFSLAILFVFQSALNAAVGVHIFKLGTNTKFLLSFWTKADICIAAHRALLHFHV